MDCGRVMVGMVLTRCVGIPIPGVGVVQPAGPSY